MVQELCDPGAFWLSPLLICLGKMKKFNDFLDCCENLLLLFSVPKLCLTLCDPMNCSTPGFPVLHYLPEFAQTYVHWVGDAIQPSHSLWGFNCKIIYVKLFYKVWYKWYSSIALDGVRAVVLLLFDNYFSYWVVRILYTFKIESVIMYIICKFFLPFCQLSFQFLDGVLWLILMNFYISVFFFCSSCFQCLT